MNDKFVLTGMPLLFFFFLTKNRILLVTDNVHSDLKRWPIAETSKCEK